MNQQPDKIFRDKLNNFQRPAPAAAWDRIETGLKKNGTKGGWWWKAAASLLLLATATYILWPSKTTDQPLAITANQVQAPAPEPKNDTSVSTAPPIIQKDSVTADEQRKEKFTAATAEPLKRKPAYKSTPPAKHSAQGLGSTKSALEINEPINIVEPVLDQPVATTEGSSKPKSLKLLFSVEETNKYLDTNAVARATTEEKKSSTFKKLLKKANDLKSNQDPFGDLREKKNEILALNFKNEKRGQNK